MDISVFLDVLVRRGITFFAGVPDSLLSAFCDEIVRRYGAFNSNHVVTHNEGGAVALASGHHLASGKIPCVYMQNSGIGNALNPAVSLTHPKVYGIPVLYVIGWRGAPGTHDEPQHVFQGEITLKLLADMGIDHYIIDKDTSIQNVENAFEGFDMLFAQGNSAAFVVKNGALCGSGHSYRNSYSLNREHAIGIVLEASGGDPVVATTGKISRELFGIRKHRAEGHERDFLTVGSMGHSIMIALGISMEQPKRRVWCLDGDGAVLMHMGSLAIVGSLAPSNLIHVVFNNTAHETVGGLPTAFETLDIETGALASGYRHAYSVADEESLRDVMEQVISQSGPSFVEVRVAIGSRPDLGRPTTQPQESKNAFMRLIV